LRALTPSRLTALLAAAAAALGGISAGGVSSPSGEPVRAADEPNPCTGEHAATLRCPDLQMGVPADMYLDRYEGRRVLRATNNVKSRGEGPVMVRGSRTGKRTMRARQHIYRVDGSRLVERTGATLQLKHIPGQGPYWKWVDAARFELWSVDEAGHRQRLVRTGPKVVYCLRDLKHTDPGPRSPRTRVFPKCSQDSRKRNVTLGTSVGWSDVYPSTYYEQWIDVTGLRGCFAYVHRADPKNRVWENNEGNNDSQRIVRLPWKGNRGGCP
jgi:hypothetical protein